MTSTSCPACESAELRDFYAQPAVPVNSLLLLSSAEEAAAFPTAPLTLTACRACGFIFNSQFEPEMTKYSGDYEETQGFSPRFREFATGLASDWVQRYGLAGKRVLEVGCGKGEFLATMVEAGAGQSVGFDPVFRPGRIDPATAERIDFHAENFGIEQAGIAADAFVCRHTLEHIPDVLRFLTMVREVLDGQQTVLLFELPDVQRILDEVAFWDVFYEHCSYFSAGSLARLFRRAGFDILNLRRVFEDQYLVIEARIAAGADAPLSIDEDIDRLAAAIDNFEVKLTVTREKWRAVIGEARASGGKVVLWGSGSKSVSFLTTVGIQDEIDYVVDINPNKHGTYNAGTGQQIMSPEFLADYQPSIIIVMNPIYRSEIQAKLDELGVTGKLLTL